MRKDIRKFVPARMSDLKVTKTKFERPKGFSIDKLLKGTSAFTPEARRGK